jgi:hypothetical protein
MGAAPMLTNSAQNAQFPEMPEFPNPKNQNNPIPKRFRQKDRNAPTESNGPKSTESN